MNKITMVKARLLCTLLASAIPTAVLASQHCPPGNCPITIRVDDPCTITAPDIDKLADDDAVYHFKLTNDKYRFPDNGIQIRNGGNDFDGGHVEANGMGYSIHHNKGSPGCWKYTVTVTGPGNCKPLDPTIANDAGIKPTRKDACVPK